MLDLDELERLERAAAPAPWHYGDWTGGTLKIFAPAYETAIVGDGFGPLEPEAKFITALRNSAAELISEIRRLRDENQRLVREVVLLEQAAYDGKTEAKVQLQGEMAALRAKLAASDVSAGR